jgi:hypothetical protein
MSDGVLRILPNGAARAGKRKEEGRHPQRCETPSARIRSARYVLGELLLKNEFGYGGELLVGDVAESLNRILIELDHLAGLQELFELWV